MNEENLKTIFALILYIIARTKSGTITIDAIIGLAARINAKQQSNIVIHCCSVDIKGFII
jgi:hypothetical protein